MPFASARILINVRSMQRIPYTIGSFVNQTPIPPHWVYYITSTLVRFLILGALGGSKVKII